MTTTVPTARVHADGSLVCMACDQRPVYEVKPGRPLATHRGRLVCAPCYTAWQESPEGLAYEQTLDAATMLEADPADSLVWPWPELARITLPMVPGQRPYFFCAFSGNGKTTFSWSAVNRWTEAGVAGYVLPLETTPHQWRAGLACTRLGISPALALSGELRRREVAGDLRAAQQRQAITAELRRQYAEWTDTLHVSPATAVTLEVLKREFKRAAEVGAKYVLVDHIDHIEPDDYKSAIAESMRVNRALVGLAQEFSIVPIIASQLNMDIVKGDALAKFAPPRQNQLMYPAVKNQVAASIIGLYRPLDERADAETIVAAKRGDADVMQVLKPGAMGCVVMKLGHQHGDAHEGARCQLAVRHGRVESLDDPLTDGLGAAGPPPVRSQHSAYYTASRQDGTE